jgi:hypothetical protein
LATIQPYCTQCQSPVYFSNVYVRTAQGVIVEHPGYLAHEINNYNPPGRIISGVAQCTQCGYEQDIRLYDISMTGGGNGCGLPFSIPVFIILGFFAYHIIPMLWAFSPEMMAWGIAALVVVGLGWIHNLEY